MQLLHSLAADMSCPRITSYDEVTGARMDFSGQTLENWVAKIANFLLEELDLSEQTPILIDLPAGWQPCVLALGALAAGVPWTLAPAESVAGSNAGSNADNNAGSDADIAAIFLSPAALDSPAIAEALTDSSADLVAVTTDAFGRGVVETGGELAPGIIDFGPTVRFYGDHYSAPTPSLADAATSLGAAVLPDAAPQRVLCTGWNSTQEFAASVLAPLAAGGSVVIVRGMVTPERLEDIARSEKVTARG